MYFLVCSSKPAELVQTQVPDYKSSVCSAHSDQRGAVAQHVIYLLKQLVVWSLPAPDNQDTNPRWLLDASFGVWMIDDIIMKVKSMNQSQYESGAFCPHGSWAVKEKPLFGFECFYIMFVWKHFHFVVFWPFLILKSSPTMKKTSGMQNQEGDTGEESFQDEKMKLEAVETAEAVFQKQPWQNKDSDDLRGVCSWKPGGSKTGWSKRYGETERAKTCRKCKGQPGSTRLFFRPQQLKVIWERQMSTAAINTEKEKQRSPHASPNAAGRNGFKIQADVSQTKGQLTRPKCSANAMKHQNRAQKSPSSRWCLRKSCF